MNRLIWARVGFVTLTLAGLVSLYQVLFDVWMTAYPFANAKEWQTRLYIRLITTIAIGALWPCLLVGYTESVGIALQVKKELRRTSNRGFERRYTKN